MTETKASPAKGSLQPSVPSKRNEKVDILKGLAIICMVAAHCGIPCTELIYLFHMAVFMMAAGYFYSEKNSATLKAVFRYALKKVLALYVPYVLCNGLLVVLHNYLFAFKLYSSDLLFLEIGGFGAVWGLVYQFSPEATRSALGQVLRFVLEPQLSGATWFLRALFYVSVAHCCIMFLIQKLKSVALREGAVLLLTGCVAIAAMAVQKGILVMSPAYKMLASCYLAYLLGIYVRKAERFIRYDLVTAVFSLVLLYLLNPVGYVSLNIGQIQSLGFFIVCSLLGWLLLRSAAEVLSGAIASFLAYAGRYSMSILMLHFICFKVATLIVILLRGDNLLLLASFPQLDGAEKGLWIFYTIVGTALPLMLNTVYQLAKKRIIGYSRDLYESICNRCCRSVGPRCGQ